MVKHNRKTNHNYSYSLLPVLFILTLLSTLSAPFQASGEPESCGSYVTDPTVVLTEPSTSRPPLLTQYIDPKLGACVKRVTDHTLLNSNISVPIYSQLQAWNANQSLVLINLDNDFKILNATTYQVVHTIDWGWPDWGDAVRWSPTDPLLLYYVDNNNSFCSGAALMRYRLNATDLSKRTRELVKCFPEYTRFLKDQSWEEMSVDGRYIALMGVKVSNGRNEIFAYDILSNIKHATLELPAGRDCDHVQMSPSGQYVVLTCGPGVTGFNGVEVYSLNMSHLANIHYGTDHSDLAIDKDGSEWLVVFDSLGNGAVMKKRIPDGSRTDLIVPEWKLEHITCQTPRSGWCAISTGRNPSNGWEAREGEIIKVYLDSTATALHIERLAHHRSDENYVESSACPGVLGYWAQPHQTSSPDGTKIIFGSSWGQNCFAESYVINLSQEDIIPPNPPKNLRIE